MSPRPTNIRLQQASRILEVTFNEDEVFPMSCEYLRVSSPSAEVQGHGKGQEVLQLGKENVNIKAVEPVGNYAVKLVFDDGHDTGLFTWEYLYELGKHQETHWQEYLDRLAAAGKTRKV